MSDDITVPSEGTFTLRCTRCGSIITDTTNSESGDVTHPMNGCVLQGIRLRFDKSGEATIDAPVAAAPDAREEPRP